MTTLMNFTAKLIEKCPEKIIHICKVDSSKSVHLLLPGGAAIGQRGGVSPGDMRKENMLRTKAGVVVQGWGECLYNPFFQ